MILGAPLQIISYTLLSYQLLVQQTPPRSDDPTKSTKSIPGVKEMETADIAHVQFKRRKIGGNVR